MKSELMKVDAILINALDCTIEATTIDARTIDGMINSNGIPKCKFDWRDWTIDYLIADGCGAEEETKAFGFDFDGNRFFGSGAIVADTFKKWGKRGACKPITSLSEAKRRITFWN